MTPHIEAKQDEIAPIVIMPGDPLRAKYIADNYLKNAKQVNSVRNMLFFTGTYKGKRITVASSGMGVPSMGIYSYELFKFYNVKAILRVGTCGSYTPDIHVGDVVNVEKTITDGNFPRLAAGIDTDTVNANIDLFSLLNETVIEKNETLTKVTSHCTDAFYRYDNNPLNFAKKRDCQVGEMESAALFTNAGLFNRMAASLLTVSDEVLTGKEMSSKERETKVDKMIEIGLDTLIKTKYAE